MSVIPEPPAQTGEPVAPGAPGGEDQRPAPASHAPADLQDLLWQRISAAMIDLAVLLAPFLVLSVPFPARTWTISGYLDYWLSEVAAHRVRPSTLRTYSIYVQDHLIPGLGKRRLHRLTPNMFGRS
jgi:Phage integrase, N-terminal SAM-like domain